MLSAAGNGPIQEPPQLPALTELTMSLAAGQPHQAAGASGVLAAAAPALRKLALVIRQAWPACLCIPGLHLLRSAFLLQPSAAVGWAAAMHDGHCHAWILLPPASIQAAASMRRRVDSVEAARDQMEAADLQGLAASLPALKDLEFDIGASGDPDLGDP